MKAPAMGGVLRPLVPCLQTARLGVDFRPVQPDQRPFLRLNPDLIELVGADAEVVELTHGIWLQIDANAQGLQFRDGFENHARHADLLERSPSLRRRADAS